MRTTWTLSEATLLDSSDEFPSVGESHIDENGTEFEITATEGNVITSLFVKVPDILETETDI